MSEGAVRLPRINAARAAIASRVDSPQVQRVIVALVVVNAITLGLETVPEVMARAGETLLLLDRVLLTLFVCELLLKLAAHGRRFFRSAWNIFDATVIGMALLPASAPLAVFRALRVLRILRLVSSIPRMRFMVEALGRSLPGLGSIGLLLMIFFYVFAVVATKLFGADFPQWFGTLWQSMFSLFQIMTLEGWADVAREVMRVHAAAWLFFLSFILLATFTVLNLFIGLIVKAMEEPPMSGDEDGRAATARDIALLRAEIAALRAALPASASGRDPPVRMRTSRRDESCAAPRHG